MDNDQKNEASHPIKNIVLVGRAGNGKSAIGNSITRQKVFDSKMHSTGVTNSKTFRVVKPDGSILNLIDTPGLCDLSVSAEFISTEIVRCLTLAKGGIHAVLFVLSVKTRMTAEEEMVLSTLQVLFGSTILDYLIVVFTGGDELEQDGITLDDYLGDKLPEFLKRILVLTGKRMIVFDNRTRDAAKQAKQVHDLLTLVDLVGKQNNNIPYTDEMYHKIKEETDRLEKEQKGLEPKQHGTEQLEAMRKELQLNYEMNLKAMSKSIAQTMKAVAEAQQNSYEAKFPEMDKDQKNEASHPIKNIVLVGRKGNGKSATGNSIAGRDVFVSKMHSEGVTMKCKSFRVVTPDGPILNVIDTPGLCDLSVSADFISKEIVRCITLAEGGIHAVLFVLSVSNRITKEEEIVLSTLQVLFGSKILDYLIVVFTGGDVLEDVGITFEKHLGNCPDFLMRILILSGKRMIVFDNRTRDAEKQAKQVHDLLTLVDLVRKQNNNIPYTDKMYRKIKEMDKDQKNEASHPIKNIVLVGRTGNGKSATGNSIARQKVFVSKMQSTGVTMECKTFRVVTPDGSILNVIDTPGLFDLSASADFISKEIVRCLLLAKGGLDAVVLVLSARNQITKEEEMVVSTLQVLFGSQILDYLIVVFTGADELEENETTFEEYLGNKLPEFLMRILILSGKRMIVFDNKTKDEAKKAKQVHDLLTLVDLVRKQNNNIPYTDEMYHKEETDRLEKEQEELEAKGHATELEAMKKELQLNCERNLKAMSEAMAQTLKAAAEAQQQNSEAKKDMFKSKAMAEMERQMREERQNQLERQMREDRQMHEERQEELERKGHATEQLEAMRKELQLTYEMNLKAMSESIAKTLKSGIEAQQHRYSFTQKTVMYNSIVAEIEGNMRKSINAELEKIDHLTRVPCSIM